MHPLTTRDKAFAEIVDGKTVESEKPYTPENASKLLNLGDIGISIWLFIKEQAQKHPSSLLLNGQHMHPLTTRDKAWHLHL
jgi:hypothetical protein